VILPDIRNELSPDLLLIGPFSSPFQTVIFDDATTISPIMTTPILLSDNKNITSIEEGTIITNEHHFTSRYTSIAGIDESSLSLSDLIYHMSHIYIYLQLRCPDVYEIGPVDRQDYDLIFDSGCTHHMVFNSSLLAKITFNDRIDILNLGSVRLGNGSSLPIIGYGDMWPFRKVLLVPGLHYNCISLITGFLYN